MLEPGHEIITGTIGMGKSFLTLYKIIKSLENDVPCMYADPKGDTYRNLLAFFCTPYGQELWEAKRHRIRLMNPVAKSGYVLGFNAIGRFGEFNHNTVDQIALVANSITSHIRRQAGYDVGEAARMQQVMEASIGLLVTEGLTLRELLPLFTPTWSGVGKSRRMEPLNPMVRELLSKTTHMGTRLFWEEIYPTWSASARQEWPASTHNKIFQYLFDERILYTTCTSGGLDFRELVDERQWLFVNMPAEMLSDTLTTLLGNLLVSKIFHTCMQRPPGSPTYRLILDEARFFNTGPLDYIFERARAYGLWLTMVVQSLNQMCRKVGGGIDEHLKETALNNTRYFSVFGNNDYEDSLTFARMMFPLTGKEVIGQKSSGDPERMPVQVEEERNRQRIVQIPPRGVVIYDRMNPNPKIHWTPEVALPEVEESRREMLETEHLKLTGNSTADARREIETRLGYWKALIAQSQAPGRPKAAKTFEVKL